ncbi:hypothetical protein BT63DRAFT_481522 [Microthyrium microscopicum]|uniref:Uncharacterized protein n=1 Tax=Microthyrium microscopicum TaxID=703497 RepID=A0A6A6U705_9PEZI|nr:hypothetical protein BT63DRAFT_481522 [Microthyrium microscopicum]
MVKLFGIPRKTKYSSLEEEAFSMDNEENEELLKESPYPTPAIKRRGILITVGRITCIVLALWGFWSLVFQVYRLFSPADCHPRMLDPGLSVCYCGKSIAEALSLGCKYDGLSASWLPPYCRDDELTKQFNEAGPLPDKSWQMYANANGSKPMTIDQVELLAEHNDMFATTYGWHIAHCIFSWEKYVRMWELGTVIDARFQSALHAGHCRDMVMELLNRDAKWRDRITIAIPVQFNASFVSAEGRILDKKALN